MLSTWSTVLFSVGRVLQLGSLRFGLGTCFVGRVRRVLQDKPREVELLRASYSQRLNITYAHMVL